MNGVRSVLGSAGRVLIVIGALVLGFVAYQLWGTGFEHASAQRDLRQEFEERLSSTVPQPSNTDAEGPSTSAESPTTSVPQTSAPPTTTIISATTNIGSLPSSLPPTTIVPPTTIPATSPPTTVAPTTAPAPLPRPVFMDGDPVARVEIPRIGVDEIVVAGVGPEELRKGPGHYPQTPLPGEPGNAALAGHRTTYGAPFFDLDQIEPGDEIIVTTYAGRFVYRMNGSVVVPPSDVSVIGSTVDDRLTLTTCNPKYSAKERLIVTAALDYSASSPLVGATSAPPDAAAVPDTASGELTTAPPPNTATAIAATGSVAPTPSAQSIGSDTSTTVRQRHADPARRTETVQPTVEPSGQLPGEDQVGDSRRWPDVLLWGLLCAAVATGSSLLGRRLGRRWVGWLVGCVPFLVVLFNFYRSLDHFIASPR